jgi:hypothetical protein
MEIINDKIAPYRYLFVLFLIISISMKSYTQTPTLLGLHGVSDHYPTMGAKVLRVGTNDYKIKTAIENNDSTVINRMRYLDSLGYTQVFYLIHNVDTVVDIVDMAWQRIPNGNDSIEVFQYLDTFLTEVGPYIDWIQINQEPLGITPYDTTTYSINEILNWWRELADFIDEKRTDNFSTLGHLKILSPSISSMNPTSEISPIIDSMLVFGEDYCDAISLHIYPLNIEHGRQTIEYYRSRTSQPLACSEFSQAKAGIYTGWLYDINTAWTNTGDEFYGLTNEEIIESSYTTPLDSTEWKNFINTAPYSNNFIPEMYAIMDSNCFTFACYASMWQYGEPIFDWTQLIANNTVAQFSFPNNPFYSEYVSLSSLINSGNFESQCQNIEIYETSDFEKYFTLYPNPSYSQINLKSTEYMENVTICVFNQNGERIMQIKNITGHAYIIDTSALSTGVYFIRLQTDKQFIGSDKIIIHK